MTDRSEEAKNNFLNGMNCAQAVLCAFRDRCGLELDTALKLASGFGGGIARQREVCGAVSGMCMAADLIRGPGEGTDKAAKDEHYAFIRGLCDAFREETGEYPVNTTRNVPAPTSSHSPQRFYPSVSRNKRRPSDAYFSRINLLFSVFSAKISDFHTSNCQENSSTTLGTTRNPRSKP